MASATLANPPFPQSIHMPFDLFLHILIGYTVVFLWTKRYAWVGAIGGLVPNLDYPLQVWTPLPVIHGGVFHTPLFLFALVGIGALLDLDRTLLQAFSIGFFLELVVDSLQQTPGIMYLYPLSLHRYPLSIPFSELYWGSILYLVCIYVLYQTSSPRDFALQLDSIRSTLTQLR